MLPRTLAAKAAARSLFGPFRSQTKLCVQDFIPRRQCAGILFLLPVLFELLTFCDRLFFQQFYTNCRTFTAELFCSRLYYGVYP